MYIPTSNERVQSSETKNQLMFVVVTTKEGIGISDPAGS